ncbi:MAG: hypothetical protein ACI87N_003679 [Flavobacteriales bacterium]|jgi:hypothetical protein
MKDYKNTGSYQFDKHWYLGFLGLIGFYKVPSVWAFFQGDGTFWDLTNLLWLLWLLYFLPEKTIKNDELI